MKIAKALKLKNRLAGELNRIKGLIERENSRLEKSFDSEKMENLSKSFYETKANLIQLKAKIQMKTAPIAEKLIAMAEAKDEMKFFQSLPTTDGEVEKSHYSGDKPILVYKAHYTQNDVDNKVIEIQAQIDALQDEIDEYNASTSILDRQGADPDYNYKLQCQIAQDYVVDGCSSDWKIQKDYFRD